MLGASTCTLFCALRLMAPTPQQFNSVMAKVTDYTYTYTPNPAAVLPAGCTDACSYTLSDGGSVTETAPITITICEQCNVWSMACRFPTSLHSI